MDDRTSGGADFPEMDFNSREECDIIKLSDGEKSFISNLAGNTREAILYSVEKLLNEKLLEFKNRSDKHCAEHKRRILAEYNKKTTAIAEKATALEMLANNVSGGLELCDLDKDFTIHYVSNGFLTLTGFTREEVFAIGNHRALVFEQDLAFFESEISKQLNASKSFSVEYRLKCKNGDVVWVIDKGVVLQEFDNKRLVQCILTDITEQKQTEQALRISEKRYEMAISFSDVTMFEYSVPTREITLYKTDMDLYALPSVVPDGMNSLIERGVVMPDSVTQFKQMYANIHAGATMANCFIHARDDKGVTHEYEIIMKNLFDSDGNPDRAIGVHKNVSQLRQLQREKEYADTLASEQMLIYEVNLTQNQIVYLNKEWAHQQGVDNITDFEALKETVARNVISPEFIDNLRKEMNINSIVEAYNGGKRLIALEYKKKIRGGYRWFRKTINIIKDSFLNEFSIRCYLMDINDIKVKELKETEEQKYYETMVTKSIAVYAINVTKNAFEAGHDTLCSMLKIPKISDLTRLMSAIDEKLIYEDDRKAFADMFSRDNILKEYAEGNIEIILEYRRPVNGVLSWVMATAHLFEDSQTNDVKAFFYLENINESKIKSLDMQYKAEHDTLTALYNKTTTEKKITEFLTTPSGQAGTHAFLIIDVDYFKSINDNFGHAFGDAVLSQIGVKIKEIFRKDDIVGRIGGDEFVVFMKNIQSKASAEMKAQEICDHVNDSFNKNSVSYKISASVGVAYYGTDGKTYEQLYSFSDTALYMAKDNGRNQITVYNKYMKTIGFNPKAIDNKETDNKPFEKNMEEYVFRILYESCDKISAVNAVLELVGKHYNLKHAYIFEDIVLDADIFPTFKWTDGKNELTDKLPCIPVAEKADYMKRFNAEGVYIMNDLAEQTPELTLTLNEFGAERFIQFMFIKNGRVGGFVSFDGMDSKKCESAQVLADLRNVANIVGIFVLELREMQEMNNAKRTALSIINELDFYAYICDPVTYKILFVSAKTLGYAPNAKVGSYCYEGIRNKHAPCENCPMKMLAEQNVSKISINISDSNLGKLITAAASTIDWVDGTKKCLIKSTDISSQLP